MQPVGPVRRVIRPERDTALLHPIVANGGQDGALKGREQADVDIVATSLQSDAGSSLDAGKPGIETLAGVETVDRAAVKLGELVAIDGIIEKIGEVVEELERGTDHIGIDLALANVARLRPAARQAEAAGCSAIGRVERTKPSDQSLIDCTLCHLIGRGPAVGVSHCREGKAVCRRALTVTQHAVQLSDVIRDVPRSVVMNAFEGSKQGAVANCRGGRRERTLIAKASKRHLRDVAGEPVDVVDADGAG